MKKVIFGLMLILGLGAGSANAQSRLSYGVKAEANMSSFLFEDMPSYNKEFGVGAGIGGFLKIDLGNNFAIQPELLFQWQNSTIKQGDAKSDFEYWGMEIPVYAVGQMKLESGDRAYIGIGPYFGLGFSAKDKTADINLYDENGGSDPFMHRGDVGAGGMIGYEFAFGMQINASYKYGFLNRLDAGSDNSILRGQAIAFGIGYRF